MKKLKFSADRNIFNYNFFKSTFLKEEQVSQALVSEKVYRNFFLRQMPVASMSEGNPICIVFNKLSA